jgi:hypothetical protein
MTSKKPKTEKNKIEGKEYFICVFGGLLKNGWIFIDYTSDNLQDSVSELKKYYGKLTCRYLKVIDAKTSFETFVLKFNGLRVPHTEKLFEMNVANATKFMKEITGQSKIEVFGEESTEEKKEEISNKENSESEEQTKKPEKNKSEKKNKVKSEIKVLSKDKKSKKTKPVKKEESEESESNAENSDSASENDSDIDTKKNSSK